MRREGSVANMLVHVTDDSEIHRRSRYPDLWNARLS